MNLLGELTALATAICWSASSLSFGEATKRAGSVIINLSRLIIAGTLLLLTILIFQINITINTSQTIYLIASGIIGLTLGDSFLFKAYQQIGARITALISSIAPGFSALLAYIFLAESLSFIDIIGMSVTITGIGIVVTEKREGVKRKILNFGLVMAFLAALGQGAALIFAKLAFNQGGVNGFVAAFIRIIAGVIILTPTALISGKTRNISEVLIKNKSTLRYTIQGSVLGPYLGITLSMIAISKTKVGIAATIMSIFPVLMLPQLKLIYKEKISLRAVFGTIIAVLGVGILFIF